MDEEKRGTKSARRLFSRRMLELAKHTSLLLKDTEFGVLFFMLYNYLKDSYA
jgi:hypothetical protein